jgi:hypothetical protein
MPQALSKKQTRRRLDCQALFGWLKGGPFRSGMIADDDRRRSPVPTTDALTVWTAALQVAHAKEAEARRSPRRLNTLPVLGRCSCWHEGRNGTRMLTYVGQFVRG